jgi:DNA-binding CsgD family transcriptional regulator
MRALGAVGRDTELAEVDAFLGELRSGSAGLALEGAPGIGKTTIWRETVRRARAQDVPVLACRPAAAEAKLSFAGVADLLAGVGDETFEALPRAQRRGLEVALLRSAPDGETIDPRMVATAFLSVLRVLAADSPVLLAVDDAQWLDQPSSGVLAFAARRLGEAPVGVLCAFRPPLAGFGVPELSEERPVRRLVLEPLPLVALGSILADRLERQLSRRLLARIAEASRGNPFFALEMGRLALSDGSESGAGALPVPDDLRALASRRLRGLPRGTRAALLRAAVLAAPDTRAVDAGALAPAEDADLVRVDARGRIEFTHPLFAAAIYASTPAARRRAVHGVLAEEVGDSEQRARHLALSADRPHEPTARELDRAAEHARARGAPDAAAELVELALGLTPEPAVQDRARRLLAAAGFLAEAGDLARAAEMLELLQMLEPPGSVRARALQMAAVLKSNTESFSAALDAALAGLQDARHDRALRVAIDLDIAFYLVGLGDIAGAESHAAAAARAADDARSAPGNGSPGQPALLGDALAVLTMVQFLAGRGLDRARLDRAVALDGPRRARSGFTRPRYIQGLLLLYVGELDEAAEILASLSAEAMERGAESELPLYAMFLVWTHLWRGRTTAAAEVAAAARDAAALLDNRGATAQALTASAFVHAHEGQVPLAAAEAREALEHFERLHWRSAGVWPRWALGFASLSAGDLTGAHAAIGPLVELLPAIGLADPVGFVFLPDEIEALIALGEHERAGRLIELLETRGREHDRPWALAAAARGRGALLAAGGELDEALVAFEAALAQHARVGMPFEQGRTLLLQGRALRRRKRWGAARAALSTALERFDQTEAPLWAQMARAELARAGERSADRFELTATERQVAELAAAGLSNREVADRAFLTVKAVEGNLTRAYRKLGIRSRGGLARALERDGDQLLQP